MSAEMGSIDRWGEVADITQYPRPEILLPLGVELSKPRLCLDWRWLNMMCKHSKFAIDGVGKVAQCTWLGAYQGTLDHKLDFHHVLVDADAWQ